MQETIQKLSLGDAQTLKRLIYTMFAELIAGWQESEDAEDELCREMCFKYAMILTEESDVFDIPESMALPVLAARLKARPENFLDESAHTRAQAEGDDESVVMEVLLTVMRDFFDLCDQCDEAEEEVSQDEFNDLLEALAAFWANRFIEG